MTTAVNNGNGASAPSVPHTPSQPGLTTEGARKRAALEFLANALSSRIESIRGQVFDPRRDVDDETGQPPIGSAVSVEMYRQLYDRVAVAARVVQVLPKESWRAQPSVYEDEDAENVTEFEKAWDDMGNTLSPGTSWHKDDQGSPVWDYLTRVDILSGIGHFGVLLIGFDDGLALDQPVDGMIQVVDNTDPKKSPARNKHRGKVRRPLPPDSPVTRDEEQRLLNLEGLTANERASVMRWAGERDRIENSAPPSRFPATELSGTGANYLDGYGIASGASWRNGTDAQYFGVRFGPSEALPDSPNPNRRKLLFLRPFDESLVQIVRYEWNVMNPRFGMPVMYRITLNDPREQHSGVGLPTATVFVHWTRVIHVADNRNSSEVFGAPRQRPVIDNVLAIRKVASGDGEAFWKNCVMKLILETHPSLGGDVDVDPEALRSMMEDFGNSLQPYLALMGMTGKPVAPAVVDPTPHIQAQVQLICIVLGVPVPVFQGYEIGEQASENNDSDWKERLNHRRQHYLTPFLIVPFVDRMIQCGVLPEPERYWVKWPDLDALTKKDQAGVALQRTQALSAYVSGGVEALMTPRDYLTRELDYTEEEAEEIIEATKEAHEQEEVLTTPPQVAGRPAAAPPGTQDHADAQQQAKQAAAALKAKAGAGGPPKPPSPTSQVGG